MPDQTQKIGLDFIGNTVGLISVLGSRLADEFGRVERERGQTVLGDIEADEAMRHLGLAQIRLRRFVAIYRGRD